MNQVIQEWRRTLDLDARIQQGEVMLTEDSPQIDFVKLLIASKEVSGSQ